MSIFSIEYGGPHSATLVCLIDAFGFAASATFAFIGGRLADSAGGWSSFMNMLILISAVGIISVWAFMHAEYKAAKQVVTLIMPSVDRSVHTAGGIPSLDANYCHKEDTSP